MPLQISVQLEDRPGTLAKLGEVLGTAEINIIAIHGIPCGGTATVQFICDKSDTAQAALRKAGMEFTTRQVLLVDILDRPGTLGDVARVLAHAGINIDAVYASSDGKVVLSVDDLDGAIQVAGGMAVL